MLQFLKLRYSVAFTALRFTVNFLESAEKDRKIAHYPSTKEHSTNSDALL